MQNCLNCGKETNNKKYCSNSCSAKHASRLPRKKKQVRLCVACGKEIEIGYSTYKKYCKDCKESRKGTTGTRIYRTISDVADPTKKYHHDSVGSHARYAMKLSKTPKVCRVCGYNKHVEVCHIKPIRCFEKNTLLSEVNSLSNLIYLCRNCHWELDEGLLVIDYLVK